MAKRHAQATLIQEHLVPPTGVRRMEAYFKEEGRTLILGPLDPEQGRPAAGVGVISDAHIKMAPLTTPEGHPYAKKKRPGDWPSTP